MCGTTMYDLNLTGPIGLVIGNEGEGVGRLVKEKCDFIASIPMKGEEHSANEKDATTSETPMQQFDDLLKESIHVLESTIGELEKK